jgi:hypothetical protein
VRSWELGGRIRCRDEGILLKHDGAILRGYMAGASESWTSIRLSRMKMPFWFDRSTTTAKAAELKARARRFATRYLLAFLPTSDPLLAEFCYLYIISASSGHEATVADVLAVVKNNPFIQIMSRLLHAI